MASPAISTPKARILVVDDAALVRLYYRDALERAGFAVNEAMNGLEAMEKLLDGSDDKPTYDLLIVDVNMPQMDGFTFLRAVRRLEGPTAGVPAMMTSTEAATRDFAAARAAGANYYLVKPLSQESLTEHVAMLCGTP